MKFKTTLCTLIVGMIALTAMHVQAQSPIKINADQKGEVISPYIYGQFIEHLGHCINGGGIWAEMLEDRKFYYAVGDKESPWQIVSRDADYKDDKNTKLVMTTDDPFVGEHTPVLSRETDGGFGISQKGIAIKEGTYGIGYVWVKCSPGIENLTIVLSEGNWALGVGGSNKPSNEYQKVPFVLNASCKNGTFSVMAYGKGSIQIGAVSLMPSDNVMGMRADTLQLLKELNSPIYRWPGGNFVSGYDWRDGIGDRDRRPPLKNPAWQGVEPNDFGLDEFMLFCKLLDTEPYIAVNTGAGEVENAFAELQYANGSADTEMGKLRAANGNPNPYQVKYWGIGNEMYGDWQIGHMPVEQYAEKHNQFVDAFRKFDPSIKVIAVGAVGKWDDVIMRQCAEHMDLISEHFYVQQRDDVIEHVALVPNAVKHIADAHRKYREDFPELKGKDIRIALDEWNYWYGEHVFGELGTRYFMKDGLGIAAGLHEYFRNSDIIEMANYAQTVNVIGCIKTNKTNAQFETTGLALKLYRNQFGVIPLQAEAAKPFDVAAALTEDQKTLTLGIVNPTDKAADFSLDTIGVKLGSTAQKFEIANDDPMAHNDPGAEQKIDIVESQVTLDAGKISVSPMSITVLRIPVL